MAEGQMKKVLIRDIMTKKIISVSPETPIVDATKIITEHNFAGLPVIDSSNRLVGILTEYDLIAKTSTINASFLQRILSDIYTDKEEKPEPESKTMSALTVRDIMNTEPLTLKEDGTFEDILETFRAHHKVNPIPIVNDKGQIVGIISRYDILRPLNILGYSKLK